MSYTNISKEPPLSDTRHLSELKFDERPAMPSTAQAVENPPQTHAENLATDMVMLQKADVWMSQFKTRLNLGIIALVLLWGTVSWYKGSNEMRLEARTTPDSEGVMADIPAHEEISVQDVDGDILNRTAPVKEVETEPAAVVPKPAAVVQKPIAPATPLKTVKANKTVKKAVAKHKGKPSGGKTQTKNQKKMKKSLAAKPAS